MRRSLHIVLAVAAALTLAACRGPRVIPRDEMEDIYCEMFLADQRIRENRLRVEADSSLVYEGIFNKYGYNTDDYLYSVQTYMKDPERFAKMLKEVSERLRDEGNVLAQEIERLDWIDRQMGMRRPPLDSILSPFGKDSLYVGAARVARDSVTYAWFRLVGVRTDSLLAPLDGLSHPADSTVQEETGRNLKDSMVHE